MFTIPVDLPDYPHKILIGANCLDRVGTYLKKLDIGESVFIITSPRIGRLYEGVVVKSVKSAGFKDVAVYHLPDGERYKNTIQWEKATSKLAAFDNRENKRLFVVNLGGGVVGDLGGFVAATYHRGTPYVQIPTTLLACVDCGVGGKVAVNMGRFKNSVGAFWQPKLVFADLSLLKTLSKRQLKSGLSEVIKYGMSLDVRLLQYVEKNHRDILASSPRELLQISKRCYALKADIVKRDARDKKDIRIVLNYGHTIGHAVESASHYVYTHGECISIGMVCANDIAVKLRLLGRLEAQRLEDLLNKVGLPTRIKNCDLDDILASMTNDKKFVHGKNRFVFLRCVGQTTIKEGVPRDIIRKVITNRLAEA